MITDDSDNFILIGDIPFSTFYYYSKITVTQCYESLLIIPEELLPLY